MNGRLSGQAAPARKSRANPATSPAGASKSAEPVISSTEESPNLNVPDHRVSGPVASLWRALATSVTEPIAYLDGDVVEQQVTGLPCVSATAVSVMNKGARRYVHANHVRIPQLPSEAQPEPDVHRYIAGQSPKHFSACETILLKAIEAREGIFQLVAPSTQACLQRDSLVEVKKLSVAPILLQLLAKHARGEKIIIGNRYQLTPVKRESTSDHIACYDLEVTPLEADGEEFSIPITQIGLKFDNALLKSNEIRVANLALVQHLRRSAESNPGSASEPIIISRKGIGRNATVIVYHEILQWIKSGRITDDVGLDRALLNVIIEGRKARSLRFVHSAPQLQELRETLLADIAERKNNVLPGGLQTTA